MEDFGHQHCFRADAEGVLLPCACGEPFKVVMLVDALRERIAGADRMGRTVVAAGLKELSGTADVLEAQARRIAKLEETLRLETAKHAALRRAIEEYFDATDGYAITSERRVVIALLEGTLK